MSKKIRVALIFGGRSAEHEVSLASAAAVHRHLDKKKFIVQSVYITKDGLWKIVDGPGADLKALSRGPSFSFLPWLPGGLPPKLRADIYFPVLHGPFGEDGTIQGCLEMAGVPYVGGGVLGSALGMDKVSAKSLLHDHSLPIVPYVACTESEWRAGKTGILKRVRKDLAFPVFVKPSNMGSSVGITKVTGPRRIEAAVETAFHYDSKILIERGIRGREIECSVLGNETAEASLPGEVIPHAEFYDYNDKYIDGKTTFVIPVELPRPLIAEIQRLAVAAFKTLDGSGLARVDFFLETASRQLYINEINTLPGFTEISMYPKLWEASGLPFPRLLERLIELGFERHRSRKACVARTRG